MGAAFQASFCSIPQEGCWPVADLLHASLTTREAWLHARCLFYRNWCKLRLFQHFGKTSPSI